MFKTMSESRNPVFAIDMEAQPIEDVKWQERAACRGIDPNVFFPTAEKDEYTAKNICGACAVRSCCLEYALANREDHGIWGGLNEKERRKIIRFRAHAR
jgi:WhiB family transcriptional regulator, redox-sensing transcriptional regulator